MSKKPAVLMTLDSYRLNDNCQYNVVCEGKIPAMDQPMSQCPLVEGETSGMAVGLPEGQMGNSKVGHLNMEAGCVVYQELTRITKSIQNGDFFQIPEFLTAIENCKRHGSAPHMFGLVSDGDVHSHDTHIYGLLELAKKNGLKKVYAYYFLDSRDASPEPGKGLMEQLRAKTKEIGVGGVASVMGHYYTMDHDKRWDCIELAYSVLIKSEGNQAESAAAGIRASYDNGKTDEFVTPFVVMKDDKPVIIIQDKDSIIFYNFRPDRTREITRAFCGDSFDGSPKEKGLDLVYTCFTDYDGTAQSKLTAFKKESITSIFGGSLAAHKKIQVRVAETEKYAYVTLSFNGGVEEPSKGGDHTLIPSPKEATTYDLKPGMSANDVCDKLVEVIKSDKYDVIIISFANPSMIGRTGIEDAATKAIETADAYVGRVMEAIREVDGVTFVCTDHGNVEWLVNYETGESFTVHTTNSVPFILVSADPSCRPHGGGALCDIVPTLIEPTGTEQPKEVASKSLLVK